MKGKGKERKLKPLKKKEKRKEIFRAEKECLNSLPISPSLWFAPPGSPCTLISHQKNLTSLFSLPSSLPAVFLSVPTFHLEGKENKLRTFLLSAGLPR